MKALSPVSLVFAVVVVGAGWYIWTDDGPIVPAKATGPDSGSSPEGTTPGEIVSPDSGKTTQPGALDDNKVTGAKPQAAVPPQAPQSEFARRLELSEEMAEKVRMWHRKLATSQSQFGNEFDDGADGPTLAKEFNSVMSKQCTALIALVGVARANKALVELPVYEFDLSGSWHRVNAEGRAILFTDPNKEDVWRNFQRKRRQP